eukprot:CAMPEP_0184981354 /NCGR_PEP_ID=MMETSP1098-20130426/11114_1 /TAXON_ID=89044 /ORGANISM="Spumella elongata, Strain CCAP 955/1" /LENGTH=227 /DNA_ID=CAMNT_0027504911 /DNA_START=84 /DNA_END=767 /DNA_ORIENTATION=-
MNSRGPPILPMYKANLPKKKGAGLLSVCVAALLPICVLCLFVFFFLSVYMGTMYLQGDIEEGSPNGILNSIGLPNTRNVIQKWSITNLHGVDLTKLGPPPKVIPLGLGSLHRQHHYFTNSSRTEALQGLTHRLGDSLHSLYYNRSSYNSPRLRGWLNSFHDLNVTDNTYKIKDYISGKTGAALQGINELGRQGVKGVSELGMRSVQSMRGAAAQSYLVKHNDSLIPS